MKIPCAALLLIACIGSVHFCPAASNSQLYNALQARYLVIAGSATGRETAMQFTRNPALQAAHVIDSDSLSGLTPGYFVVVESMYERRSVAAARVNTLKSTGIDAYVKYAGQRIGSSVPLTAQAAVLLRRILGVRYCIHCTLSVDARGRRFPLLLAAAVGDEKRLDTPVVCRQCAKCLKGRLFIFFRHEPFEIVSHPFHTCGINEEAAIECMPLRINALGQTGNTAEIASQLCLVDNLSRYGYAVFDKANLHEPFIDSALCTLSAYPDLPHEIFVPGSDTLSGFPCQNSKYKGDGETLVEGVEAQGTAQDAFGNYTDYRTRDYREVWRNGKQQRLYEPWVESGDTMELR